MEKDLFIFPSTNSDIMSKISESASPASLKVSTLSRKLQPLSENLKLKIFLSLQAKQCSIITYKHGIYELPHELMNDLRLRKLRNMRKVSKPHTMIA